MRSTCLTPGMLSRSAARRISPASRRRSGRCSVTSSVRVQARRREPDVVARAAALGLGLAYARGLSETVEPVLVSLNSLPRIAIAPILLPLFGLGIASKIALSFVTVFFVVFFNTYLGIRSVDPELVKAVQVMGGTREHLARFVVLPSVFSWIFAALRTSVSFALTGAVVGEFVGASSGLGYRLSIAAGLLDT